MRLRASQSPAKAATLRGGVPMLLCVNELTDAQRQRVLHLVREGLSFRAIERMTGHRRETISRYVKRERSGNRARVGVRARMRRA